MLRTINFTVRGDVIAKPRMTQRDKWKKRKCVVDYYAYADKVRAVVLEKGIKLPEHKQVVDLSWTAWFEVPSSMAKIAKTMIGSLHKAKPDRDNIDKAVLDILFPNGDSGVACGTIGKFYGTESRIDISITFDDEL